MEKPTKLKKDLIAEAIAAAATTPKTDEERQAHAEKMNKAVSADLIGVPIKVGNLTLRPFTLATASMLKEIESPLIMGVPMASVPNIVLEVMRLLALQSATLSEARAMVADRDKLDDAAYAIADSIPVNKTSDVVEQAIQKLREASETQVTPIPSEDTKKAIKKSGNK